MKRMDEIHALYLFTKTSFVPCVGKVLMVVLSQTKTSESDRYGDDSGQKHPFQKAPFESLDTLNLVKNSEERGWKTIVSFQNPEFRSYLIKPFEHTNTAPNPTATVLFFNQALVIGSSTVGGVGWIFFGPT